MITIKKGEINRSQIPVYSISQTVNLYISNKSINGFMFDFLTFIPAGLLSNKNSLLSTLWFIKMLRLCKLSDYISDRNISVIID